MYNTTFHENEIVISPPSGKHEEISGLRAVRGQDENGNGILISCFQLEPKDIERIQKTGKVYLAVMTENYFAPVCLTVHPEDLGL